MFQNSKIYQMMTIFVSTISGEFWMQFFSCKINLLQIHVIYCCFAQPVYLSSLTIQEITVITAENMHLALHTRFIFIFSQMSLGIKLSEVQV